jgi:hypothetical protein
MNVGWDGGLVLLLLCFFCVHPMRPEELLGIAMATAGLKKPPKKTATVASAAPVHANAGVGYHNKVLSTGASLDPPPPPPLDVASLVLSECLTQPSTFDEPPVTYTRPPSALKPPTKSRKSHAVFD